jgi:hypothetical protein
MRSLPSRRARVPVVVLEVIVAVLALALDVWLSTRRPAETATGSAPPPTPPSGFPALARKPAPVAPGFKGCPAQGDGGDRALNVLKNRIDTATWLPATVDAIVALDWPRTVGRRDRARWSASDSVAVARYQGTPVVVEGYLAGVKEEGPESCNCHGADDAFRDWHMWLTASHGEDRARSVVIETTPVIRAAHSQWTLARMRAIARAGARLRVSGWLLLDQEHPDQIGKTRGTVWEIHPIIQLDVEQAGSWVPLDSLEIDTRPARAPRRRSTRR